MGLFRKRDAGKVTRLFVASDLHGSTVCFRKFLHCAQLYEADALMLAGDLTGKVIVPIVRESGGLRSSFGGRDELVTEEELAGHIDAVESAGLYPYVTTREEVEELQAQPERVDALFQRMVVERLAAWMELADERLGELDRDCYVIPGNDDDPEIDHVLEQRERVHMVDGRRVPVRDGLEVIGMGASNMTPWRAPRDFPERDLAQRLDRLWSDVEHPESTICLIHVPPADSTLDLAPEIDEELRPKGAGDRMVHVGSTAVRELIESGQPLLSLHGHIHESPGIQRIGRTTAVNPGSEYSQGVLRGALVNVSSGKVHSHMLLSG